jgi:kumamolisin
MSKISDDGESSTTTTTTSAKGSRISLPGSSRSPPRQARMVGSIDPKETITVTLIVRRRKSGEFASKIQDATRARSTLERSYLSRDEFENTLGADPTDLQTVERFAHDHGLDVVEVSAPRRSIILRGTVENLSTAFGVSLKKYEREGIKFRAREGAVTLPASLKDIVQSVHGLDDRPQARPHFRISSRHKHHATLGSHGHTKSTITATGKQEKATQASTSNKEPTATSADTSKNSFLPIDLAKLYNFPQDADGTGQTIGIIELGGGHRKQDLDAYFNNLHIKAPIVTSVSVDAANNDPSDSNGADSEVMLDIEVAGATAPGANIVVYYAPNTDQGFLDAITKAIHDRRYQPSVISISWGSPEDVWTEQSKNAFNDAFQDAAALGVTVCCAAGDDGSSDERPARDNTGINDGLAHVDFPASSPFVLACGGTKLISDGQKIATEVVWNETAQNEGATGGGVSDFFEIPDYQKNSIKVPPSVNGNGKTGRGVPDVAGDADPSSGYAIRVDGQDMVIGGTSAVAPLYAGLIAILNQKLGKRVGFLNPVIYQSLGPNGAFNDIIEGDNDVAEVLVDGHGSMHVKGYKAGPGWDPCTGWGTPAAEKILSMLSK